MTEDLCGGGNNVGIVSEQSYSSVARVSSRLNNFIDAIQKLDSQSWRFENDIVCHSEQSEESQNRAQGDKIPLNPPLGKWANDYSLTPSLSQKERDGEVSFCIPQGAREKKPAFTLAEGATHVDMQTYFEQGLLNVHKSTTHVDMQTYFEQDLLNIHKSTTHVDMFHDIRKPAFTLAEVLVTLGIIGIVAAMTLPMLAKNYQFYIRQQQFKKAYAAMSIAVQKTQIDMGEGVRCYYLGDSWGQGSYVDCDLFFENMSKELQVIKTCQDNSLEGHCIADNMRGGDKVYAEVQGGGDKESAEIEFRRGCSGFSDVNIKNNSTVYVVNGGFSIIPYVTFSNNSKNAMLFAVDINSLQGPNKWGHDIFIFQFGKKRLTDSVFKLEPATYCRALDFGGYYTNHFLEYLYGQNAEL